jgi:hypothetical protein
MGPMSGPPPMNGRVPQVTVFHLGILTFPLSITGNLKREHLRDVSCHSSPISFSAFESLGSFEWNNRKVLIDI